MSYGPRHIVDPSSGWDKKKVTMIDGVPHRIRRGKLVPIPEQWFGHKTDERTKRKRKERAKLKKKVRVTT